MSYHIFTSTHIQYLSAQLARPIAVTRQPETRQLHLIICGDQSETSEQIHSIAPIAGTDLFVVYTTADDGTQCLYVITDEEVTNTTDLSTLQQLDRDPDDTRATRTKVSIR